jgi:hypothetical protein
MKNLLCLCAGLILIYLYLMNIYIAYIFLWHPFDSRHKYHIVFGTNSIWFFLVMVLLDIFLFNLGSGICYPVAPSTMFDRWIFWKTYFCWSHMFIFPMVSGFRWALPPAHTEPSVASPSDLCQLEIQWWTSSFILQTSCLEDVNLRITRFRLCKIKRLKVFQSMASVSRARSRSNTNPAFCTAFSPLLDFSGSAGFGTWRIFVPLFWAFGPFVDSSLFSYCFGF